MRQTMDTPEGRGRDYARAVLDTIVAAIHRLKAGHHPLVDDVLEVSGGTKIESCWTAPGKPPGVDMYKVRVGYDVWLEGECTPGPMGNPQPTTVILCQQNRHGVTSNVLLSDSEREDMLLFATICLAPWGTAMATVEAMCVEWRDRDGG